MKVKTSLRSGGISHNHSRKALKVRTKAKASGLAVTNSNRRLLTPAVKAMVDRENDELAAAALAQLLPARLNSPLVPLIRCANRTKAGEPCGSCWYCKRATASPDFNWELPW